MAPIGFRTVDALALSQVLVAIGHTKTLTTVEWVVEAVVVHFVHMPMVAVETMADDAMALAFQVLVAADSDRLRNSVRNRLSAIVESLQCVSPMKHCSRRRPSNRLSFSLFSPINRVAIHVSFAAETPTKSMWVSCLKRHLATAKQF